MTSEIVEAYAWEKLHDLAYNIFSSLSPAREALSDNLHFVAIISPTDFKRESHQEKWAKLQKMLLGKTKNIGLQREPIDRLTVRNRTLLLALNIIWELHEECSPNVL